MTIRQFVAGKVFTLFCLSMSMLLPDISLATDSYQRDMPPMTTPAHNHSLSYCQHVRIKRQTQINSVNDIEIPIPLRQLVDANCFTPAENIYFIGLAIAQEEIGSMDPWHDNLHIKLRKKAELACQIMGYNNTPTPTAPFEQCVNARTFELLAPYEERYQASIASHINNRNRRGEELTHQCVTAFHHKLPRLPRQIQFPLAYYDKKLHSYPAGYLEGRIGHDTWLENSRGVHASDLVRDVLGEQCPGNMIFWLYLSNG